MRARLAAAVAAWMVACGPAKTVEQENGLLGFELGTNPAVYSSLVQLKQVGDRDVVWHEPESGRYWGAAPISVQCHAWRDQIWKIEVRTGNSKALLPQVTKDFGTPPFSTPWQWDGATVRMNFRGTEYDSTARLIMVKKPLEAERDLALGKATVE